MSWTFLQQTMPRGRKEYQCDLCGLRIRKRARHVAITGVLDGELVAARVWSCGVEKVQD